MPQLLTPAGLPAALAALKGWLAITGEADDAALALLLGSSAELCAAFTAGGVPEAEWADLPEAVRHGIIRLAAHLYRERDRDGDGAPVAPPAAVAALWRPWRAMRLA